MCIRMIDCWGTWMAQSVKRLTLDFNSGHDLMVYEINPHIRLCADIMEPAWDSLSLLFSLGSSPSLSLKKKPKNKVEKKMIVLQCQFSGCDIIL